MATSNSYTYALNKTQIIEQALDAADIWTSSDAVPTDMYDRASNLLNMMIKLWEVEYIHLWKRKQATLFLINEQNNYQIGNVAGADRAVSSYVDTTLSADEAAAQTVLSVTSTTGFSASMVIGIELNDDTRQWTTIVSVDSGASTITITTALTGAASSGSTIVAYSTSALINRPLRVLRATLHDLTNDQDICMNKISYDTYFDLPNKTYASASPNSFYYDRLVNNSISHTGTLYLYPTPSVVNKVIKFSYLDSMQDMLETTDNADFPQEWTYPIVMNLAYKLALRYGKSEALAWLEPEAKASLASVESFDSDDEPLSFDFE